jgi:sec-independent protein translocase protein TatB
MFNIGGGEILVISLVALIVLGPQRLPDAARQVGKAMGELRRLSTGFQNELKGALDDTGPAARSTARDPLGAPVATQSSDDPVRSALDSVSGQPASLPADPKVRAPRREPLKAAPTNGTTPAKPAAKRATKRTTKRTPTTGSTGGAKRSSTRATTTQRRPRTPR